MFTPTVLTQIAYDRYLERREGAIRRHAWFRRPVESVPGHLARVLQLRRSSGDHRVPRVA